MGYINNEYVVINANLTQKGREQLAKNGSLNITGFALADDEIDYRLFNPNHPLGSAYYDIAIRNTPVMEAVTDESQVMKYKLVTLNEGVSSIPTISVAQQTIIVARDYTGEIIISPSTNPTYNVQLGYTAILANKNVGTLVVTETNSVNSETASIPLYANNVSATTTSQTVVGNKFRFIPNSSLSKTTTTNITIIGNESGGSTSITVTVKVNKTLE